MRGCGAVLLVELAGVEAVQIDALRGDSAARGQRERSGSGQRCQAMVVIHVVVPPKDV